MTEKVQKHSSDDNSLNIYWKKFLDIISEENQFFKNNPHLESFRTKLIATIIVIFYVGVLALASKGLSALLVLLKVPYNNCIAIMISVITFICITIKDMKNNPLNMKMKKRGKKMNKKAWFGLDPRLELIIAATVIFILLVSAGVIPLK
jgi:hypothetical protein